MSAQRGFIETERPSDFVDPALVFGDGPECAILEKVGAAIADTGDQKLLADVKRGDERRPHAFEFRVRLSQLHYPAVGGFDGLQKNLGIPALGIPENRGDRFDRYFGSP